METESPRGFRAIFSDRNLLLMLALGFSSGLPFRLIYYTPSIWYKEAGVPLGAIGLLYEMMLPFSFKFLWAPYVDQFDAPIFGKTLGRRRGWMLLAQIAVALTLIGIAFGDPAQGIAWNACFGLALGFAAATQDIVIDGWRISVTSPERQGLMASAAQYGYQIALFLAGAGSLYIAQFGSWRLTYLVMAAFMTVGAGACLIAPEPPARGRLHAHASMSEAIVDPLREIFSRFGPSVVVFLALISIYRLPDYLAGAMANVLYTTVGFTKAEIATVSKLYGFWIGLGGVFVGGLSVARLGLMPSLLIGGLVASLSHLSFAWLSVSGHRLDVFTLAISAENFSTFFASTVLIAFMSTIVSPAYAATQYALLTSLYALIGKFAAGASGFLVEKFGYPAFFISVASLCLPITALCLAVWRVHVVQNRNNEASPEQNSLA